MSAEEEVRLADRQHEKLSWSRSGFRRRVGMSTDALFVIVEGKDNDRFFYGELCHSSEAIKNAGYQVWIVQQTSRGGGGGKDAVLAFYEECRSKRQLKIDMGAGVKRLAFCVDNDGDEVLGKLVRSQNVIYTHMHDVEAEIFAAGDPIPALAVAIGLDRRSASTLAARLDGWLQELAALWSAWIELCLLAKGSRSRCGVGYGTLSSINTDVFGAVDPDLEAARRADVEARSLLKVGEFRELEKRLGRELKTLRSKSQEHRLIKGRWMRQYLANRIPVEAGECDLSIKLNGVEGRLISSFAAYLDIEGSSVSRIRRRLERLVAGAMPA